MPLYNHGAYLHNRYAQVRCQPLAAVWECFACLAPPVVPKHLAGADGLIVGRFARLSMVAIFHPRQDLAPCLR